MIVFITEGTTLAGIPKKSLSFSVRNDAANRTTYFRIFDVRKFVEKLHNINTYLFSN
jgi:hypothetical protein